MKILILHLQKRELIEWAINIVYDENQNEDEDEENDDDDGDDNNEDERGKMYPVIPMR